MDKLTDTTSPYSLDDKIFYSVDEEGKLIGDPTSYNEELKKFNKIKNSSDKKED